MVFFLYFFFFFFFSFFQEFDTNYSPEFQPLTTAIDSTSQALKSVSEKWSGMVIIFIYYFFKKTHNNEHLNIFQPEVLLEPMQESLKEYVKLLGPYAVFYFFPSFLLLILINTSFI